MDNKTPVLTDSELVRVLRGCVAGCFCIECPFGVNSPDDCVGKLMLAAADRIERSENE